MKRVALLCLASGLLFGTAAASLAADGGIGNVPALPWDGAAGPGPVPERIGAAATPKALAAGLDFRQAMARGGDYLRRAQADVTEDNAGNGTSGVDESPDDPDDGGWDWRLTAPAFTHSTAASPQNIYGATAQGALRAYLASGDAALLTVLADAADRMAATATIRSAADVIFLMTYDDLPAVPGTVYQDAARAKYDARILANGSAAAFAALIRDTRATQGYPNGIIGWDVGAWAVAAQMLADRYPGAGYDADADAIAEVMWQDSFNHSPGHFDVLADQGFDPTYANRNYWWYNLGITGLIDAFRITGSHADEIPGLVAILLAGQHGSGAMDDSYGVNEGNEDWQTTAYAAMTLAALDRTAHRSSISRMAWFLAATQDAGGGWVYAGGSHYPEIGGECTAALSYGLPPAEVIVDDDFTDPSAVDAYNALHGTGWIFGFDAFGTIQAGIDAVAGSTVTILPGVYEEQLDITSDVTLAGAGVGRTIIRAPAVLPLSFNTGSIKKAIVYVHGGASPTITGVTVDGAGRGNLNVQFLGIGFWNAGGTVAEAEVVGVRDTPFSGAQHGVAIYAYNNTGGPYQIALRDVYIDTFQKNALALLGVGLAIDLDRVTAVGVGPTAVTAQNGIQIGYGAGGTIDDCRVVGFHWTGATWTASGVLLYAAGPVVMSGLTIDGAQTSGYFYNSSLVFQGGSITNPAGDGLLLYNADAAKSLPRRLASPVDAELAGKAAPIVKTLATNVISGATLTGAGIADMGGIVVYAYPGDVSLEISDCTVGGWDYGLFLYEGGGGVSGSAHGNRIAGNATYGAWSNTAVPFAATGNWWGHTSGPRHAGLNPAGLGNPVSDGILFDPWLGAGGLDLLPASSGPLMCGETATLAFRYAPDGHTPALRGYEVTFRADAAVGFGPADILDSGILGTLGTSFFHVADNGDGTFTVTGAILGATAGLTAAADLFHVTFHGAATGTALVEVTGARLRDLANEAIGTLTADAIVAVDCTPPGPVAGIAAVPGHRRVVVAWTDPPADVVAVEIWRGLWHDGAGNSVYPGYDDVPGNVVPARPASRAAAAASGEWVLAGTVPAGAGTFTDGVLPRGVYYYEAFATDAAGNHGPPAAANDRATNYWLGDVYPAGTYDGLVDVGDISILGASFATREGNASFVGHCDVGPTDDNGPRGIPATDGAIDLEDLMIFALNYSLVGPAKSLPEAAAAPALAWTRLGETRWALSLLADCPNLKGLRLTVPLPEGVRADVGAGSLVGSQTALVFLHGAAGEQLDVNLAIMGAGVGFAGTGELFVVDLSAPAELGSPRLDARGLQNEKLEPTLGDAPPSPAIFHLAQNAPNPFNPATTIAFSLAETRPVRLAVYSVHGRLVRTLLSERRAAGRHEVVWDGRDESGRHVASGTYFCRIDAGAWQQTRKMVLMK